MSRMDRKEAAEILYEKYSDNEFYYAEYDKYPKGISDEYQIALDIAISALQEPERILKQLEELRDDPIMHCSEDYWEGHYMAAKEAIAIVRGEEE